MNVRRGKYGTYFRRESNWSDKLIAALIRTPRTLNRWLELITSRQAWANTAVDRDREQKGARLGNGWGLRNDAPVCATDRPAWYEDVVLITKWGKCWLFVSEWLRKAVTTLEALLLLVRVFSNVNVDSETSTEISESLAQFLKNQDSQAIATVNPNLMSAKSG